MCCEAALWKLTAERESEVAWDRVTEGRPRAADGAPQEEVARPRGLEARCGAGLQQGQVFLVRLRYRLRHYATARQVVNI